MAAVGHFGCPKFTFDRISGHFRSIGHFGFPKFTFYRNSGHFGCPKITFDRISGHFWSIGHIGCPKFTFDDISGHFRSIRILILFKKFGQNGRRLPFWMSENNFRSQFLPFQIDTRLFGLDDNISYRTRPRYIWMNNACVKFEERSLNPSKVIALTTADAADPAAAALLTKT